jgi:hypothetical protein
MPKQASPRKCAAARKNLEKAWEASRRHWEKTPARMANSRRTIKLAQAAIRGRPRKLSPAQLAAVRRNVARARAVMARRGRTPEHLAKLRETLKLARAARTPASYRLHNQKILRHGLFARSVRQTMRALGQNVGELDRRIRLLNRYFAAEGSREEKLIRALARALWRHERLYYAQADWECRRLDKLLLATEAPPQSSLPKGEELRIRAYNLLDVLNDNQRFSELDWHMAGTCSRLMRRLLRARFGPNFQFRTSVRVRTD